MSSNLFKIYLNASLHSWKKKCHTTGIKINGTNIYTLLFADHQLLLKADEDDMSYVARKSEDSEKWGLEVNIEKAIHGGR